MSRFFIVIIIMYGGWIIFSPEIHETKEGQVQLKYYWGKKRKTINLWKN